MLVLTFLNIFFQLVASKSIASKCNQPKKLIWQNTPKVINLPTVIHINENIPTNWFDLPKIKIFELPFYNSKDITLPINNTNLLPTKTNKWLKEKTRDNLIKSGTFSWKIVKSSNKVGKLITQNTFIRAFELWARASKLIFVHKPNQRTDINILFTDLIHLTSKQKTCVNFKSRELGHAFFPSDVNAGELHINDNQWFNGYMDKQTFSLLHLATHEIGHLLGLEHNSRKTSIMYPFEPINRHFSVNSILDDSDEKVLIH